MRELSSMTMSGLYRLFSACDFLLQLHQSVEKSFRPWRTSRNVNIHRNHPVNSLDRCVVVVEATRAGANSKCDNPFGITHLFINAKQNGSNFFADRTHNQENVRLPR